jgi:hypothetical protein
MRDDLVADFFTDLLLSHRFSLPTLYPRRERACGKGVMARAGGGA